MLGVTTGFRNQVKICYNHIFINRQYQRPNKKTFYNLEINSVLGLLKTLPWRTIIMRGWLINLIHCQNTLFNISFLYMLNARNCKGSILHAYGSQIAFH